MHLIGVNVKKVNVNITFWWQIKKKPAVDVKVCLPTLDSSTVLNLIMYWKHNQGRIQLIIKISISFTKGIRRVGEFFFFCSSKYLFHFFMHTQLLYNFWNCYNYKCNFYHYINKRDTNQTLIMVCQYVRQSLNQMFFCNVFNGKNLKWSPVYWKPFWINEVMHTE